MTGLDTHEGLLTGLDTLRMQIAFDPQSKRFVCGAAECCFSRVADGHDSHDACMPGRLTRPCPPLTDRLPARQGADTVLVGYSPGGPIWRNVNARTRERTVMQDGQEPLMHAPEKLGERSSRPPS